VSHIFSGVPVTGSLVLCACFIDRCLFVCTFSFGYCVVCSSSFYGFRLPLWYLQTLLIYIHDENTLKNNKKKCERIGGTCISLLTVVELKVATIKGEIINRTPS